MYRALVEGHDVLGEGARLVGEDVLDLTKLLVQRGCSGLGRGVVWEIVHLTVPVDQFGEEQTNDLVAPIIPILFELRQHTSTET